GSVSPNPSARARLDPGRSGHQPGHPGGLQGPLSGLSRLAPGTPAACAQSCVAYRRDTSVSVKRLRENIPWALRSTVRIAGAPGVEKRSGEKSPDTTTG